MKRGKILTSIDVGTTKICTIIADTNENGGVRVLGVGITPSHGLHKGLVVNINEATASIRDSVKMAEQACNYKVESAYVGVTGRHVTSENNRGVVSVTRNDRVVRPDDLKRVLASAQSIKVPTERRLLHVIPRGYAVDGQAGVKNPVGMHGFRLDVETHVITAARTSIQNLIKCIRNLRIDIEELVLEPLASSEAVLTPDEKQVGVILADIGGGTTDVAIFREGSIWHTAILPVAGYQMTRDVAIGLGLPFEHAEQMKRKYGSIMPECYPEAAEAISQDGHGISYRDLCEIIRLRVEEILKLIVLELPSADHESLIPAGLVLTGGSSNVAGLASLAQRMLRFPVRIGVPSNMHGIGDVLRDPAYATSVGLLLWGANHSSSRVAQAAGWAGVLQRMTSRFRKLFN